MSQNTHYNITIIRGRKVVCNREWLGFIRRLTNSNGSRFFFFIFFIFEEFSNQSPNLQTNNLVYQGIIAAVRECKVRTNIQPTADYELIHNRLLTMN